MSCIFYIVLSIHMVASIPWIHVLISDMYMYMCPWFAGLLTVFVLVLAKARKTFEPSLHVLPSCFRRHLLHSILSRLLHFLVSYPEVPETWQSCNVPIMICSLDPPWNTDGNMPWAFPEEVSSKTLISGPTRLWHWQLVLMTSCTILAPRCQCTFYLDTRDDP